ncbi:MAG: sel1 repeat family protein, partial [Victivallales bacterium]|nr:sel1 repeat family protein [Victivallales bacterium]
MTRHHLLGVLSALVLLISFDAGAWSLWPFGKKQVSTTPRLPTRNNDPNAIVTRDTQGAKSGLQPEKKEKADKVSMERLQMLAEKGNPGAQLALGRMHYDGSAGLEQDFVKAADHFYKAARGGNDRAVFNYGLCLALGRGVEKDTDKALEWFVRAAEMGVPQAQKQAAVHLEGRKKYAQALRYLRKLAADGDAWAIRRTAMYLIEGLAGDADPKEAVAYLKAAAGKGDARCQVRLADCYERGLG